jgi:hypothetical protein
MVILAYVDPGTGLLAWQAIVAACVGAFFYIKKTRDWLKRLFLKLFSKKTSANPSLTLTANTANVLVQPKEKGLAAEPTAKNLTETSAPISR